MGKPAVEELVAAGKWLDADEKMKAISGGIAEYQRLDPVPEQISALVPRHDALVAKLQDKRRERDVATWIERAESVVGDKTKCEDKAELEVARKQVEGLRESDVGYGRVQELTAQLDDCVENLPPPSQWHYDVRKNPMGGVVATAGVESSHSFDFDFPYQGTRHARLAIRGGDSLDVILSIERGQFICPLGCSVMVRFDEGPPQRWRAVGPSDHSTGTVFLSSESKFVKQLQKAKTVRIQAEFFQEGSRVLEFPVARFDSSKLR